MRPGPLCMSRAISPISGHLYKHKRTGLLLLLVVCCGSRHNGWEKHLYCCLTVQFLVGQGAQHKSCHPTWLSSLSFLALLAEAKDWMSIGDEFYSESLQIRTEACWKSNVRCLHTFLHGPVLCAKKGIMISWGYELFYQIGVLTNGLRKWPGLKATLQKGALLEQIGLWAKNRPLTSCPQ